MITDRCALCPGSHCNIPPHGPQERGGILFVGEAPGYQEENNALKHPPGLPFIGKTGQEVDRHYLPLAGLRRDTTCFTNAIRCLPPGAGGKLDPKRAQDVALLDCCATTHLYPLIERMQPRAIVPMGNFACQAVSPGVNLEIQHGHPATSPWGIPTFPMYHPAMGMHEPKKMLHIRTDWHRLRKFLSGTLRHNVDLYPNPDYAEVTDAREIRELNPTIPLAADTESSRQGPFCLTYSQQPGHGRLIRAERRDLLKVFQQRLDKWASQILFHNWLYDWVVVEEMGLQFPVHRVVDTMARVYHLGNLPQGLKALSQRELGMAMEDFEDVVSPYSTQVVLEYYRMAYAEDWPKPEPQLVIDEETGKWKLYRPQSMKTKFKRFFTDYTKAQANGTAKDVFAAWENWDASHAEIEAVMGPWPGMDIRHVPFENVIHYACRDSDALIRLWDRIRIPGRIIRHFSQEWWQDKNDERRQSYERRRTA